MTPLRITRRVQCDLYAYNAGILNARRDYEAHPNEFTSPAYCTARLSPTGTGRRCETCMDTRAQRTRRAGRRAAA